MLKKVVSLEIKLVQEDIDYLKSKASEYLQKMGQTNSLHKKKRYWILYNAYWDLFEQNKDRINNDSPA